MEQPRTIRNGQYRLVEVAGRGGMAVVWRAIQHGDLGFIRTVAVKQMHEHLSDSQLYINMFAEEARVCAALQSPNIAQVYDFIEEDGKHYLVLEWIDGIDLGSLIRHFKSQGLQMPWDICAAVGVGILRALADAHEREDAFGTCPILHRDISPHNILVTTRGMVKLIDFGLALAQDRQVNLTDPGVVKGKMSYLSPEIVLGERPSIKSDQFSVGSVLWESLAAQKLFDGESDFDVYTKLRNGQVAPIRPLRRDLPRGMVAVLQRALATEPDNRFSSAREMGRDLGAVLKSSRTANRDLHAVIGQTVLDARQNLQMGRRTGEHSTTTPIAEPIIDHVTLPGGTVDDPKPRTKRETTPVAAHEVSTLLDIDHTDEHKGLLHRLPFFGKRR